MIQWALQDRLLNEETSTQLRHHLGRRGKGEKGKKGVKQRFILFVGMYVQSSVCSSRAY